MELSAEHALFQGQVNGLVLTFHTNERPLQGLAGLLDWRFQGAISHCLRAGALTGNEGECAYVPITRNGRVYHLILVGGGALPRGQKRAKMPPSSMEALKKNLKMLKIDRLGVSRSDFGDVDDQFFSKEFKGISLNVLS